jgi:hypothetical protein
VTVSCSLLLAFQIPFLCCVNSYGRISYSCTLLDNLFFFFFLIIILYRNCIYYMYCALREVVRGRRGEYNSKRQSPATLRSLGQQSRPGEDRSQRLILHRPVRVKLRQGVGPLPRCTAAGSEQRLVPLCTSSILGREGEQGTPYSSLTIHIVLPLACMGLGNVKCKHRLICL